MKHLIHNPLIREKIEYITGSLGYIIGMFSLNPYFDKIVAAVISSIFGLLVVVLTHFTKRYLAKKYPIEK